MAYKLYDQHGNEVTHHNLQDKGPWCQTGATFEEAFVAKYGAGLDLIINPVKATDPYVPDLLNISKGNLADLKTQNTPFFQAETYYKMDPQFAVTFNLKDHRRYKQLYPNIDLYFWVDWLITGFVGSTEVHIEPMSGIWMVLFSELDKIVATAPVHSYARRQNDQAGNARDSYVLSLRHQIFTRIV
jgi:hypothetical protein